MSSRGRPYRLGLLFVHGMGEQERGDTITEMGDALTEWLRRWIAPIPGNDFRIRSATLRQPSDPESIGPGSSGPSAQASVVLVDAQTGPQDWLLAESWWAGEFRPATFGELTIWAISVGPWLIASQAGGILGRIWSSPVAGWPAFVSWPLKVLSAVVVAVLAAAVASVVTPIAFALLVVSRIPVPFVSDAARALAQNLAGSFGDLLVLVRSPIRFAAMSERVRADIARLDAQCERVMIVAHSQGSAVAWQAIRRAAQQPHGERPRVGLFVSFGQALRKLKSLYHIHEVAGRLQLRFSLLALLSSAFLLILLVGGLLAAWDVLGWADAPPGPIFGLRLHWLALALAAVGILVTQLSLHAMAAANDDAVEDELVGEIEAVRAANREFRWIDLWSSADPASNGPLFTTPRPSVEPYVSTYKLRNTGSLALDHSTYWWNVTEFVSGIAYLASALAGPNATRTGSLTELRRPIELHDQRVLLLALGRVAYVVAAVTALLALAPMLVEWGVAIRGFVAGLPLVPDGWAGGTLGFLDGLLAAGLLAVAALAGWLMLLRWWRGTAQSDQAALFDRRPGRLLTIPALLWIAVTFGGSAVAVAVAGIVTGVGWPIVAWLGAAILIAAAVVLVLTAGGRRLYET